MRHLARRVAALLLGQGGAACPLTCGSGVQYPDSPINVLRISPGVLIASDECQLASDSEGAVLHLHVHACVRTICEGEGEGGREARGTWALPRGQNRSIEQVSG